MANVPGVMTVAGKDVARMLREKSFLFIVLAQLLVVSLTLSFGTVFPQFLSGSLYLPDSLVRVGVVGDSAFASHLADAGLEFEVADEGKVRQMFEEGAYDVVVIARNYSHREYSNKSVVVELYVRDDFKKLFVVSRVTKALKRLDAELRSARLGTFGMDSPVYELSESGNELYPIESLYTLLIPLFIMLVSVVAGNLTVNLVSAEFEEKTFEYLMQSPLSPKHILAGKVLASLTLSCPPLILWLYVIQWSGYPITHPILLTALGLCSSLLFAGLGALSSAYARSRDEAQNIFALALMPLLAFLLPLPESFASLLTPALPYVPSRIITHLSLSTYVSSEILRGLAVVCGACLVVFTVSLRLAEKRLRSLF